MALGTPVTDAAPPDKKSAYVAPTTIPKAQYHPTMESELVKLSPDADPRNAPTQLSWKVVKRHERRLSSIAFVAGAVGALVASLLYLDVFTSPNASGVGHGGSDQTGVDHHGSTESNDGAQGNVANDTNNDTNSASQETRASDANASGKGRVLDVTQLPLVQERVAAKTEKPAKGSALQATTNDGAREAKTPSGSKPSPVKVDAPETTQPVEAAEPGAPKPNPETATPPATTSKVWVEPPPRKVWVE